MEALLKRHDAFEKLLNSQDDKVRVLLASSHRCHICGILLMLSPCRDQKRLFSHPFLLDVG